jgi:hypothetical protein
MKIVLTGNCNDLDAKSRNKKCLPSFTSPEFMQLGVSRVGVYFATPVAPAQIKSYRLLAPAAFAERPTDRFSSAAAWRYWINHIYLSLAVHNRDVSICVLPLSPKSSSYNVSARAQLDLLRINMNAKSSMKSEPNGARPNISSKSHGPDDAPVRKWKRKTIFDNSRKPPFALKLCARDEILERLFSEKKGSGGEGS